MKTMEFKKLRSESDAQNFLAKCSWSIGLDRGGFRHSQVPGKPVLGRC